MKTITMKRILALDVSIVGMLFLGAGCFGVAQTDESDVGSDDQALSPAPTQGQIQGTRNPSPGEVQNASHPAGAHLSYHGGRVVSHMNVVVVIYGSGNFLPQVTSTTAPNMASFYQGVLNSPYVDWLSEYNTTAVSTPRSNQSIGRGSFTSQVTITPSAANNGATIDDSNIQAELSAQIQAGHLPAPTTDGAGNNNTYYAVFFPHGKTITGAGSTSCVPNGFCAYHSTIANAGGKGEIYYGVHPDMQAGSGCTCGGASTVFGNYTQVASHEMVETITDPEIGLTPFVGPPIAWYDLDNANMINAEIGDLCNNQHSTVVGGDGRTYDVQTEFSNVSNDCITTRPPKPGPASADPAGYVRSDAITAVVRRASNNHVHELFLNGTGWHAGDLFSGNAAPAAAGNPSPYVRSDGINSVVYRSADNHIRELALLSTGWAAFDLSGSAATAVGDPTGYVRSDGISAVVYRSADNHIRELALLSSGWTAFDLSAGGAPAAASDPVGYVRSDGITSVVYRNTSNHIEELALLSSGWTAFDLSGSAPTAVGRPHAYVRSDGISSVVYRNASNHIEELALLPTGWAAFDLSGSAPTAVGNPSGYVRADGINAVVYRNASNHVEELALLPTGWFSGDLSGAGAAAAGDPFGYVRSDKFSTVVYKSSDGHVRELALLSSGWSAGDLTAAAGETP